MREKKLYNIAIVGLGNIGCYLYNFLNKNKDNISNKNNSSFKILYISAKNKNKKRNIKFKKNQWVDNFNSILKNKDVDNIVELIGGAEGAAKKLVFGAIRKKRFFIISGESLNLSLTFGY